MQISNVEIQNFMAIKEAKLALSNQGLLLIQGQNKDDPSADSNGSGKSSLVDALCWCLFGVTARGISGDSVVNRLAKKGTSVEVTVAEDGGNSFKITRTRKPNSLEVVALGSGGGTASLTCGTEKETQALITRILGCSQEVFMAAVYAGQEAMPDLPGMTDKMLKTIIEEAAGVSTLTEAYAYMRNESSRKTQEMAAAQMKAASAAAGLVQAQGALKSRQDDLTRDEEAQKKWIASLVADAKQLKESADNMQLQANAIDHAGLTAEAADITKTINGLQGERDEARRLQTVKEEKAKTLASHLSAVDIRKSDLARKETALKNVGAKIGTPCGECGKPYSEHDLETATKHAEKARDEAKESLRAVLVKAVEAKREFEAAEAAESAFWKTMSEPTELTRRLTAINAELGTRTSLLNIIQRHNNEVQRLAGEAKRMMGAENPIKKDIVRLTEAVAEAGKNKAECEALAAKLEEESRIYNDAVNVLGPSGVRAHILDTVTPFLNDRTAVYLGALSDGCITANWSTLARTAKGEFREKFCIEVSNSKGADSFAGLSGGEKRKVRLACALALQDLVATRATKPINLFIADEVDHALDESGLERLMSVLEQKARERGTVLVISHNSLSDWIDNVVTVVKEGGYSKVEAPSVVF